MISRLTSHSLILALAGIMLFSGCGRQLIRGNLYREGFKQHQTDELIAKLKSGTYAIFPFKGYSEAKWDGSATDGNAVADLMAIQMLYNGYKVLEREKMQKILEEQSFQSTNEGAATPNSLMGKASDNLDQLVKMGKVLGVDYIVTGSVIQYQYNFSGSKLSLAVTLTARVIDVQTGSILFAMSAGTEGNNLPQVLDGITVAFTDALKEKKIYVWE